ncbi:hypothetical protein ACUL41_14190 [Virgibacillus natechei]
MKKMITTLALGVLLVAGFSFAQNNQPNDTAFEVEPTILSVEKPSVYF